MLSPLISYDLSKIKNERERKKKKKKKYNLYKFPTKPLCIVQYLVDSIQTIKSSLLHQNNFLFSVRDLLVCFICSKSHLVLHFFHCSLSFSSEGNLNACSHC